MTLRSFIPLGIFAALGVFLIIGLGRDPAKLPSELIEKPFPDFDLEQLRGPDTRFTQDDIKGEVVLINVFGSWCVACLSEHATLMQLQQDLPYPVIGLNWRDEREAALNWLDRHGNPYDTIIFDPDSKLAIQLGVSGAPETFITDRNGYIRYKYVGPLNGAIVSQDILPVLEMLDIDAQ